MFVDVQEFGAVGDGQSDDTAPLQACIDENAMVWVPPGFYAVSELKLRSDRVIEFSPGVTIRRIAGGNQQITLKLVDVHNVEIRGNGLVVDGNQANDNFGQSHCVGIQGGADIRICDVIAINAPTSQAGGSYGDGFYLGSGTTPEHAPIENIELVRCKASHCFRHAAFLVNVKGGRFIDCHFSDTQGADPGSAINLECNGASEMIVDVHFVDCSITTSQQGVTANNHYGANYSNIHFTRCEVANNRSDGIYASTCGDGFSLKDCNLHHNAGRGAYLYKTSGAHISGNRVHDNGGNGVQGVEAVRWRVTENEFIRNGGSGCVMGNNPGSPGYLSTIKGNHAWNNGVANGDAYNTAGFVVNAIPGVPPAYFAKHTFVANWCGNLAEVGNATQKYGVYGNSVGDAQAHDNYLLGNRYLGNTVQDVALPNGNTVLPAP